MKVIVELWFFRISWLFFVFNLAFLLSKYSFLLISLWIFKYSPTALLSFRIADFFYYLFELSDAFNIYALDHVHTYHSKVCITRYSLIWFWPLNPLLVSKFCVFHFTESNWATLSRQPVSMNLVLCEVAHSIVQVCQYAKEFDCTNRR